MNVTPILDTAPILVCYDDSGAARAAIRDAVRLFPGAGLRILTVWKRFETPRVSSMVALQPHDVLRMATALEAEAEAVARRGVAAAQDAGAHAVPVAVESRSSTWRAILDDAAQVRSRAIVIGARSHSALASAMLGGTASMVAAHADLPVVVVHEPTDADLELQLDEREIAAQLPALGAS